MSVYLVLFLFWCYSQVTWNSLGYSYSWPGSAFSSCQRHPIFSPKEYKPTPKRIPLGNIDILTMLLSFHYLSRLQFFSTTSYSFQCTDLSPPWLNLFLGVSFFFVAIVNGMVFLISLSASSSLTYRNATFFFFFVFVSFLGPLLLHMEVPRLGV